MCWQQGIEVDSMIEGVPSGFQHINIFAEEYEELPRWISVLSNAVTLTDDLAEIILTASGVISSHEAIGFLRSSDLVISRGIEWRLDNTVRDFYLALVDDTSRRNLGGLLRDLSRQPPDQMHTPVEPPVNLPTSGESGIILPNYLLDGTGWAYHSARLNPSDSLRAYSLIGQFGHDAAVWLGTRLASSQANQGILPVNSKEIVFLKGISSYREGLVATGVGILRPLVSEKIVSREVAIALHLVGRFDGLYASEDRYRDAVRMLRKSISMGVQLGDVEHEAQAKHSLAVAMLRGGKGRRNESDEVFALLEQSRRLLQQTGDWFGYAQVLNTSGWALASGKRGDRGRAVRYFEDSLAIGLQLGRKRHVVSVLANMARLEWDYNRELANSYIASARLVDSGEFDRSSQGPWKDSAPSSRRKSRRGKPPPKRGRRG